jgi:hypothetical protein
MKRRFYLLPIGSSKQTTEYDKNNGQVVAAQQFGTPRLVPFLAAGTHPSLTNQLNATRPVTLMRII